MNIKDALSKLTQILGNPKLIFEEENSLFLEELKNNIYNYEIFANEYRNTKIENQEDHKGVKKDLEKLNGINELFRYIGKKDIDSVIENVFSVLNENKKYKIDENMNKLNIKDDKLANKINEIISNYNGKSNYYIENNKLCLWFDSNIENERTKSLLEGYKPIISGNDYTKIILREV